MRVWPGSPYPLGATWDGAGVNFALFSEHATSVELCLFDSRRRARWSRLRAADRAHRHGLARLPARRAPGQLYGYRVHGPWSPQRRATASIRPRSCSIPYAKVIGRPLRWDPSLFAFAPGPTATARHDRPTARRCAARRRASIRAFTWGDDRAPRTPWHETVIYELHVKGFTALNAAHSRRRCAARTSGLASEPAIQHLRGLGVTAVELMPVHTTPTSRHLVERGLTQLLGLQHAVLLRAGRPLRDLARRRSTRSASSR